MAELLLRDLTGYDLTCGSEEALNWFNKAVFAYTTVRENGVPLFSKALELDNSTLLAHCVLGFIMLADLKPPTHPQVSRHLDAIKSSLSSRGDQLTPREHAYIRAVLAYASGSLLKAAEEWCTMLVDYPLDALGIRITVGSFILLGEFERMRDMLAAVLTHWTEDMQHYPYILGFYGYALEECRERTLAEEVARRALTINKTTPFATHAMSHVFEEVHEAEKGVEFLTTTREDWRGSVYEVHITWHLALYYLDLEDTGSVFREFDSVIFNRATADNLFGLLDASSLLWRLNVLGIEVGEERWKRVTDAIETHVNNHRSPWFDTHIMMGLAHGKVSECTARLALAQGMIKTMESYSKSEGMPNSYTSEKLGVPVCNALLAFGQERYDEVLQIMLPLRYDFHSFGGSWAQRQVFSVTMIQAAVRANKTSLALALVTELKAQKPKSKRLEKLFTKLKSKSSLESQPLSEPSPLVVPEPKRRKL